MGKPAPFFIMIDIYCYTEIDSYYGFFGTKNKKAMRRRQQLWDVFQLIRWRGELVWHFVLRVDKTDLKKNYPNAFYLKIGKDRQTKKWHRKKFYESDLAYD